MSNKELADLLLNAMKNQVELEDGRKRELDAVDYYLISNVDYLEFLVDVIKDYNAKDKILLHTYGNRALGLHKNQKAFEPDFEKAMNNLKTKELLNSKLVVNVEFDEFGNYIEGSGRVITEEEKIEAFDFIHTLDCPFSEKMFRAVINRIVNDIPLDDTILSSKNVTISK